MIEIHLFRLGIVLLFVLLGGMVAWKNRHRSMQTALIFALTLVITAGSCWVAASTPPWDDESLRLMILHSLVEDGDINLADDYLDESWRVFRQPTGSFFEEMADRFRDALIKTNGRELYPFYGPADAVLNLPGFALARLILPDSPFAARFGARLTVWLAAAALIALFYRRTIAAGITSKDALLLAAALLFAPMHFFFGVRLWPEIYAALVLMLIIRHHERSSETVPALALGLLTGILPLLHVRYLFISLPVILFFLTTEKSIKSRLFIFLGAVIALSPFPLYWALRHHEETRLLYRLIHYPDPTLTSLAPAFSLSYLNLGEFWIRFISPPAGWVLYAPALFLIPWIRGWRGREALLCGAVAIGMSAQILLYCAASGPVGRYWSPLLPLVMVGLAGTRIDRFRGPLVVLIAYGALRALFFGAFPIMAFDSKIANQWATGLPEYVRPLVFLLFG